MGTLVLPTWQLEVGPLKLPVLSDAFSGMMKFGMILFGLLFHISACLLDPLCKKDCLPPKVN